jgi:hypothetical protein
MKKSTLATLFAGLFAAALAGSTIAHDGEKMLKIEMDKEQNGPAVLKINHDGDHQVFEFTDEQLQDPAYIESQLADLDENTRNMVMNALKGVDIDIEINNDGDDRKVFVIAKADDMDGHDGDQRIFHKVIKRNISDAIGHKIMVSGGHAMNIHQDPAHATQLIKTLLNKAELTPEQIEAIQQQLDAKQ